MLKKLKKQWKSRLLTALACNFFLVGTLLLFAPLEVFVGNYLEFYFQFNVAWQVMLLATLGITALVSLLELLLPRRVALFFNAMIAGLGLCCYVQMMFLNGKMITLNGAEMRTTRPERIANLGIWAAMLAATAGGALFALKKKKSRILQTVLRSVSALLTVMQATALIVFAMTTDMTNSGGYMFAGNGRFEVAKQNNTLVFVFDTSENTIFNQVLAEFPDVNETLSGFTYYPNTTGMHSRTFPSLPYLLTGEVFHYDRPVQTYLKEALENGTMLQDLKAGNVDSRVYTWEIDKLSKDYEPYFSNYYNTSFDSISSVSAVELFKGMLNISLYKVAPYRLKYELEYEVPEINQKVIRHDMEPYEHYDYEYYHDLLDTGVTVNEEYAGAFRFYHLFGSHHDMYWNEDMKFMDVGNQVQPLRGSMRIIEEFVRMLDEQGVLDETTIIITADHGQWGGTHSTEIQEVLGNPPNPMMLVKYAHSDMSQPLAISHAPVSQADIFATVIEGCGLDKTAYGRTMREIPVDEQRERYYYYTCYSPETSGELYLREYKIDGDANTYDSWTLTGNQWDVQYSVY